ncbi:MAG TPA: helix-turn-helix transcriptional regulator [Caulobacteraceae bacterium]|nr:helix-turn-helix transcriptional regulator [Caulobacteraceae bacterium]
MSEPFSAKLALVLKVLSLSRARMAADLGVHKSVVGRWFAGAVRPSAHNLAALTAQVARRSPGFTILDWDRDLDDLAALFGVAPGRSGPAGSGGGLPIPLLGQALAMTAQWGAAYEGFFRSTRPFAQYPGRFVHDHCLVRRDGMGLLRLHLATGSVFIDAWLLPLKGHVFIVGSDFTNATMAFGLLNGVVSEKVETLDGLIMSVTQGTDLTPTATAIVLDRVGDLSGDRAADDARFADLAGGDALAPEGSIPEALQAHLARDIGPTALALGGDWLLRMPASRSLSGGVPHPVAVLHGALTRVQPSEV